MAEQSTPDEEQSKGIRSWYDAETGCYHISIPIDSDLTEQDRKVMAKLFAEAERLKALREHVQSAINRGGSYTDSEIAEALDNEFHPDYVSPPGETLSDTLETTGMSQAELARRMDCPVKTIHEIIQGKAAITVETARQLEQVLTIPASFWLNREQQYRESLVRLAER